MNVTRNMNAFAYRGPLWRLQDKLSPMEQADFQFSTLDDLEKALINIQNNQLRKQNLQCLVRIKPFLETMEQYGKIIEVFLNTTNVLAFVWGPMKFILQTVSNYAEVFEMIVDSYQNLGECLPQFKQYEELFRGNSDMQRVLEYVYEDILDFHRKALKIFRHQRWYYLFFRCSSKGLSVALRGICDNLRRHKSLVENQAHIAHYIESQESQKHIRDELLKAQQAEKRRQIFYIKEWLSPTDYKNDHERYVKVRSDYPQTGQWLLRASQVKKWLTPSNAPEPWQLWLYGIPGAGKTVLASMIIEEVKKRQTLADPGPFHSTTTALSVQYAYFYCKYEDAEKNNFLAIMRALIAQLALQNRDSELSLLLYEMIIQSEDARLSSRSEAIKLLNCVLEGSSATHTYFIVDGLDECATSETIINIIDTLNKIIEPLNRGSPGAFRLFYTSRDENIIRKQLSKAVKLKIKPADNEQDIKHYTTHWSSKIQNKFELSNDERQDLESNIMSKANGMFLFCALLLQNLLGQCTKKHYYQEMDPDTFPKILTDIYRRIFTRIESQNMNPSQRESAFKIMGSLAFSKRPLKKYEVQGFFALNMDGTVDYKNCALRDDIKDLCGCLIDLYGDSIDFVHSTVKEYLVEQKRAEISYMERSLPVLCLCYLNSRCFSPNLQVNEMKEFVLDGSYSLLEYTSIYWVDHIRSYAADPGLFAGGTGPIEVVSMLTDLFNTFWDDRVVVDDIFSGLTYAVLASKRDLQSFEYIPELFEKLIHINYFTLGLRAREIETFNTGPLKRLEETLQKVRRLREELHDTASDTLRQKLSNIYGTRIYKCTLQACQYFSEGFSSRHERDEHQRKHNPRYFCPEPGCDMASIGYSTAASLKNHMSSVHISMWPEVEGNGVTFPSTGRMDAANAESQADGDKDLNSSSSMPVDAVDHNYGPDLQIASDLVLEGVHYDLLAKSNNPRTIDIEYLRTFRAPSRRRSATCIQFSPDGGYIAIAFESSISIFHTASGKELRSSLCSDFEIYEGSLCFSPDNRYLAAVARYGRFCLVAWEICSGMKSMIENQYTAKMLYMKFIEFLPDSKRILIIITYPKMTDFSMVGSSEISIWRLVTGSSKIIASQFIVSSMERIDNCSLSPDGQCLAARLPDGPLREGDRNMFVLRIWDLRSGESVDTTLEHYLPKSTQGFSSFSREVVFTSPRGLYYSHVIGSEGADHKQFEILITRLRLEKKDTTESSNTKINIKAIYSQILSIPVTSVRLRDISLKINDRHVFISLLQSNRCHIIGIWEMDISINNSEPRLPTLLISSKRLIAQAASVKLRIPRTNTGLFALWMSSSGTAGILRLVWERDAELVH